MATVSAKCKGTYGSHYTLYLEYYINSQSITNNTSNITVKMYAKSDSSSYGAYNTNSTNPVKIVVNGSTVVDKKQSMDFRNKKTVNMGSWTGDISHNSDGSKSISISGNFSISGTSSLSGGSVSTDWTLTTIPRASSVTCADGNIGSATTININRASSDFKHTITYSFKGLSGTIADKTSDTSIGWTIPTSFYEKIQDASSGKVTINCTTYNGSDNLGTKSTTANVFVINSNPTVSATVEDINTTTIALTGDKNKLIRYVSNAKVTMTATALNSATIKSYNIINGSKTSTSNPANINEVDSGIFDITCIDSRGLKGTTKIEKTIINYIRPVIVECHIERESTISDVIKLNLNGQIFNGSLGTKNNTITLQYRYKKTSESQWSDYISITPTLNDNYFSYSGTLDSAMDYRSNYNVEVKVSDLLGYNEFQTTLTAGIPIIDIGKDDVNINGDIKQNGELMFNNSIYSKDEKIIGEWYDGRKIYRKVIIIENNFSTSMTVAHNITNLYQIINQCGTIFRNGKPDRMFPLIYAGGTTFNVAIYSFNNTNIEVFIGSNLLDQNITKFEIVIEYIKTSD